MAESLTLSEQKHLDILEAAKAAFLECGFDNVSMDVIADRASVSKRTVYNHFESKEALFEAITEQLIERVKGGLRVDYDPTEALAVQLRTIAEVQVRMSDDEEMLRTARMLLAGMLSTPDSCQEALQRAKWEKEPLTDWIRAAQADGKLIDCDPEVNAHLFRSMLDGMFFWPRITGAHEVPADKDRDTVITNAVGMFLGLFAQTQADKQ